MEKGNKVIIPEVCCYSNFREPAFNIPECIVEVAGYFNKKDIVVTGRDGRRIRVTFKNDILLDGIEVGKVVFPVLIFDTGKILSARFHSDALDLNLVRNFPKHLARRKYYEVLLNERKIGYLISAANTNAKIIIRVFDGYNIYSWFFGLSAMKIRMSFDF